MFHPAVVFLAGGLTSLVLLYMGLIALSVYQQNRYWRGHGHEDESSWD
jgi:hypothetical protein